MRPQFNWQRTREPIRTLGVHEEQKMTDQQNFETIKIERKSDHPGRTRALLAKRRLQAENRKQREINTRRREAIQIQAMIEKLDRAVLSLDGDINAELEQAQVRDLSHFAYSIFARAMTIRRDNLKTTIAILSERLAKIDPSLIKAVEGRTTLAKVWNCDAPETII
jgi:hypothetical protein